MTLDSCDVLDRGAQITTTMPFQRRYLRACIPELRPNGPKIQGTTLTNPAVVGGACAELRRDCVPKELNDAAFFIRRRDRTYWPRPARPLAAKGRVDTRCPLRRGAVAAEAAGNARRSRDAEDDSCIQRGHWRAENGHQRLSPNHHA